MAENEEERSELYLAIVDGDFDVAAEATQALIDEGLSPDEILDKHVVPAMDEVGALFDEGEYFVPELFPGLIITQVITAPTHIERTI